MFIYLFYISISIYVFTVCSCGFVVGFRFCGVYWYGGGGEVGLFIYYINIFVIVDDGEGYEVGFKLLVKVFYLSWDLKGNREVSKLKGGYILGGKILYMS